MENNRKGKANEPLGILMRVIKYMVTNHKLTFLTVLACIILSTVTTARGMLFIQSLVDDYIQSLLAQVVGIQAAGGQGAVGGQGTARGQGTVGGQAALDFTPLFTVLCELAALCLVSILASYAYNRVMVTMSQGTMKHLRIQLFEHMEFLPIKYFDTHAHGNIMPVYTNSVDTLRRFISQSVPQVINPAVTLTATVVSMLLLNVPLTLFTFAMTYVMPAATRCLSGRSAAHFGGQQKALGIMDGYIGETMDDQKMVKVFCHENQTMKEFEDLNERLRDSAGKANQYVNLLMPVNSNIGNLSYVLCVVAGALLALSGIGEITIRTIMAFVGLNKNFTQPVTQISQQMNSVVMVTAGTERVFELLDGMPEEDQGYVEFVNVKEHADGTLEETDQRIGVWAWKYPHKREGAVTYKKMEGGVVFDGVDFGYDDSKVVLHDTKMLAEPGQKIALVGSAGTGKITITSLINRFYNIQDGEIRYDGININKVKKPALHRSLGIVLQDTHLFTGTVMDNIRYGRLDATGAECMNVAKLANADSFVRRLPDNYETVLTGDGGSLSQGQRQLLAMARTAVADPPVLILDETTSSIDIRAESLIQAGVDTLMKGRTTFVIAHRLSTIRSSGCIMVMEQGRIIERGSRDELIHRKRRHYQLYMGNFKEAS